MVFEMPFLVACGFVGLVGCCCDMPSLQMARLARLAAVEGRQKHGRAAAASLPVATALSVPVASSPAFGFPSPSAPPLAEGVH